MRFQKALLPAILAGGFAVEAAALNIPLHKKQSDINKAEAIKEAFTHSWEGYVKYAYGKDELRPVSNTGSNSRNGWGASVVDALTTAIMMGMDDVVLQQLEYIATIDFTTTSSTVSLFETTIRYLGGLISGYDLLTGPYAGLLATTEVNDQLVKNLITQAVTLADRMSFAFNTTSGVPANNINFSTNSSTDTSNGIATIGTLVLEWTRLSDLTGDPKYATLAQKGESYLLNPKPASSEPFPGLIGSNVNIANGQFLDASGGWSGGTDSFYEYLIKMYVYDPTRFSTYKDRWILAAQSTMTYLQSHPTTRPDITFVAEYNGQSLSLNEGHLTCFIGGNFILGGQTLGVEDFTQFGLNLTSGCHDTYNATVTKIGPERFSWNPSNVPATQLLFFQQNGFYVTGSDYILRPEVIESYYHAYVNTKDEKYREWAWTAFQGINKYCRTDTGYSSITNVNAVGGGSKSDVQESFWFAEVLKYLYLIFDDSKEGGFVQGTQGWVFNTEAHPFKVAAK
ncbi:uncharacterized protein H6S33_002718 [Morchella sextelata]|uniref:uncharacterized protein n=1 Tax=Morchella sextelata TaxID=1174677 RepID=UPI001D05B0C8|nr:uncharacterized protein H6S33_002718 [Morchella sextelata]KAH0607684.1 hypothetical protein H6S33_002718 [Morchella sextelata]